MKKNTKKVLTIMATLVLASSSSYASYASFGGGKGDKAGGGGEPKEIDVENIRDDIANWIDQGGSKALKFPVGMTNEIYSAAMLPMLAKGEVTIGFVDQDDPTNAEKSVTVDGQEKTCRGFRSEKDNQFHILCHRGRFKTTSEDERYVIVHHEYAGLARIEKNDGAKSDYEISKQLSAYLVPVTILRLAIKTGKPTHEIDASCRISLGDYYWYSSGYRSLPKRYRRQLEAALSEKGYEVVRAKKASLNLDLSFRDNFYEVYVIGRLLHPASGFKLELGASNIQVVPDPARAPYEEAIQKAKTISERVALQQDYAGRVFKDTPARDFMSVLLEQIPTCSALYGPKVLTDMNP